MADNHTKRILTFNQRKVLIDHNKDNNQIQTGSVLFELANLPHLL